MEKLWDWIEKNRWTVIVPLFAVVVWFVVGVGCVPKTESPIKPGVQVSAAQLELDYETWQSEVALMTKRFDFAAADIERQVEQWNNLQETLMTLASGSVTTWSGLLQMLFTGGFVGVFADNIRKNGVIGGLKRNRE